MPRTALKPDAHPLAALGGHAQALSAPAMRLALQRAGALLDCLERLLTQSAATPVPLPGHALLQLCSRVLSVDHTLAGQGADALHSLSVSFTHALHLRELC